MATKKPVSKKSSKLAAKPVAKKTTQPSPKAATKPIPAAIIKPASKPAAVAKTHSQPDIVLVENMVAYAKANPAGMLIGLVVVLLALLLIWPQ